MKKPVLRYNNLWIHILYWVINVLFFTLIFASSSDLESIRRSLIINLMYLPGALIFVYVSVEILFSRFLFKGFIFRYLVLQTLIFVLYPLFSTLIRENFYEIVTGSAPKEYGSYDHVVTMLILVAGMVPVAIFKISSWLKKDRELRENTERAKLETELKLKEAELNILRSQIHPHFLFNTLNNLYSLALEKSDRTPELIIKLSDMLSYVTYDATQEKVPLHKEVDFLMNYISLERIRYDDDLDLECDLDEVTENILIPPMILHTFVENSFKHGSKDGKGNFWIKINLGLKGQWLNFSISNSKGMSIEKSDPGIGIENVKKRLQLIYPGKYQLSVSGIDDVFSVVLNIHL